MSGALRSGPRARGPLRLGRWLTVSALLHLPLTPLAGLLGFALLLAPDGSETATPVPPITEIPIELLPDTETPPPAAPEAASGEVEGIAVVPDVPAPRKVRPPPAEYPDAGAPLDAGPEADAGVADAEAPDAASPDAGALAADAGVSDAGRDADDAGAGSRSPLAVGGARGVVDPNANVRVLIDSERLRGHALGVRVGKLLGSVHQWRDFFGPTGIDPIRDIDRIFITGAQLRDSSGVVALIQHRIDRERLRTALSNLVQRDASGEWLDAGVPAAKARADRAERFFVMPTPNLVVVTPESALASALRMGRKTRLPRSPAPEVVTVHVQTPWRVFIGTGLSVPRSLRWADVHVMPLEDGGAVVRLVAEDEDEAGARTSAARIERAIEEGLDLLANASNLFALLFGSKTPRLVQSVQFTSEGTRVVGSLTFSEAQVGRILDLATRMLVPAPAPKRLEPPPAPRAPPDRTRPSPTRPAPQPLQ